ncbi:cytochrome P450 [Xylariaceae sp. FL0804]|nr:cytochrome P450 [Xylariaceae sp. FL0804]
MGTQIAVLIVTLCSLALLFTRTKKLKARKTAIMARFPGCQPPRKYPHWEPFLGVDLLIKTANLIHLNQNLPAMSERHKRLGKTFIANSLGQGVFYTIDAENFKCIYETNWLHWGNAPARQEALEPFCGLGLINTDGDDWKSLRDLTRPAFSHNAIVDADAFDTATREFLQQNIRLGATVDLAPLFYQFFLGLSGEFLIGKNFRDTSTATANSKPCPVSSSQFIDAFHSALSWLTIRVFFGFIGCNIPNRAFEKACGQVHGFLDHHIEFALKNNKKRDVGRTEVSFHQDLPYQSLGMAGILAEQTSDRTLIRSQLLQSIMCMQETTSTLVSNTMYLLSRHPTIWSGLRQELGTDMTEVLTAEKLKDMKYLQNILRESLRIYPVFATYGRTSLCDTILPKGGGVDGSHPVFIPKDSRVITLFYGLNRDVTVFGDDVEVFRPDRWNDIQPGTWEYLPFSKGPRSCPGREKAMFEAAFVVAKFAQHYKRIESRDGQPWAGEWALIMKNAHGCKVALYND